MPILNPLFLTVFIFNGQLTAYQFSYKAHLGDFALYESAMNNDPMTTNLTPSQLPDTDSSSPDELLNNNILNNDVLNDDILNDKVSYDGDELSLENYDYESSEDDDSGDDELLDSEDDEEGDDASVARQAVPEVIDLTHITTEDEAGLRIDKLASQVFTDFSRAQLQGWVSDGSLLCNDNVYKPKQRCKIGDVLHLSTTLQQHSEDQPEDIDIDVVNALLYHYPQQHHLPRAGLVHRIDKDTSGLLLIGKTKPAQMALMDQLKDKSVYRHYQCVVAGDQASLMRHRRIDAPIGRHRNQRTKMTVMTAGREAVTHLIEVTALNDNYCLLDVRLETGRTHQIRVHLSHVTYPIVGDRVYGGRRQLRAGLTEQQRQAIGNFPRQALHAYALGFVHPTTGEDIEVTTPIPEDMMKLIDILSDGYDPEEKVPYKGY